MIALAMLRAHLKDPPAAENGLVRAYERAAVAYIERRTGRYFGAPVAQTEYLRGVGQREIWLAEVPIGPVALEADGTAVDAADFTVRGRRLRHVATWGSAAYPVDIVATYTAGYTTSGTGEEVDIAAPDDIREAVLELVTLHYEQRLPVAIGTVAAKIPHRVEEIIQAHRRVTV